MACSLFLFARQDIFLLHFAWGLENRENGIGCDNMSNTTACLGVVQIHRLRASKLSLKE